MSEPEGVRLSMFCAELVKCVRTFTLRDDDQQGTALMDYTLHRIDSRAKQQAEIDAAQGPGYRDDLPVAALAVLHDLALVVDAANYPQTADTLTRLANDIAQEEEGALSLLDRCAHRARMRVN